MPDMSDAQHLSMVHDLDASVRGALLLADRLGLGLVGIDLDHALCQIAPLLAAHGPRPEAIRPA